MKIITKKASFIIMCITLLTYAGCTKNQDESRTDMKEPAPDYQVSTAYISSEMMDDDKATEAVTDAATEEVAAEKKDNPREKILIAIDPGHQSESVDMSATEPNAPGSDEMKRKATEGTTGRYTNVPEYMLNLDISLMLRDALKDMGYQVIMTREDNDTAISNKERACLANDAGADVSIRIHANGSDDPSTNGALALIGSADNQYVGHLYDDSFRLADAVLSSYCECTGMNNLGVSTNDTMTGINWSEIPVMILEMGFMSNEIDDRNMEDEAYQEKMVAGIVKGIEKYYGLDGESDEGFADTSGDALDSGIEDTALKAEVDELLEQQRKNGTVASAYMKNLKTGQYVDLSTATHRSASIIKLYIAGCVYQNMSVITASDYTKEDIDGLVGKMISVSDNDAANTLVRLLGGGDADEGMARVTDYANTLGCHDTSMGRLMLDFNSTKENYTTVTDTASFIEGLYRDDIAGADKIISYMKAQERISKIPAGLPNEIVVANKTGELDDVEHDVAIVYGKEADYIICVMLSQLSDGESGREAIREISARVYEAWR